MSLIASFVINQILKSIEYEFINHNPEIREAFVHEVELLAQSMFDWADGKIKDTLTN